MNALAWEHFHALEHVASADQIAQETRFGEAKTPASDARVRLYFTDAGLRFRAFGDPATLACANYLCSMQQANPLTSMAELTPDWLATELGLDRIRWPAALLVCDAYRALEGALAAEA